MEGRTEGMEGMEVKEGKGSEGRKEGMVWKEGMEGRKESICGGKEGICGGK